MTFSRDQKNNFYQETKENIFSLLMETGQVFIGFVIMLIITNGNPSGWIITLSVVVGMGFVFLRESKRWQKKQKKLLIEKINTQDNSIKNLNSVNLTDVNLRRVNLRKVNLRRADLTGADLTGADLTNADLTGADLIFTYLDNAKLTGAKLSGSYLYLAKLYGADLTEANLIEANLTDADLTGADLTSAHLIGTNLTGVNLTGADLTGADLTGADLTDADLTRVNVNNATFGQNFGINLELQRDLQVRGARFRIFPENKAKMKSSIRSLVKVGWAKLIYKYFVKLKLKFAHLTKV